MASNLILVTHLWKYSYCTILQPEIYPSYGYFTTAEVWLQLHELPARPRAKSSATFSRSYSFVQNNTDGEVQV